MSDWAPTLERDTGISRPRATQMCGLKEETGGGGVKIGPSKM